MATIAPENSVRDEELLVLLDHAVDAACAFVDAARAAVRERVSRDGRIDRTLADAEQHVVHGLAWYASYAELMAQVSRWAAERAAADALGDTERWLVRLLFAEYGAQLRGGIAMNQGEVIRPHELVDDEEAIARLDAPALLQLIREGGSQDNKSRIAEALIAARGRATLEQADADDTIAMIRDQFHAFSAERIAPFAHDWHLKDAFIPIELVSELGEMGVFGMTMPEAYGGLGLGKTAMCVVSEELSRGWIGVGSLATRSEIAGELILSGGTEAQRQAWLPGIAAGTILPTAVFTEPNTGSDLAALRTRAERDGDGWRITGNKTWITHAARADVMMLLARSDPATADHRGLSMFIAPKQRGGDCDLFPDTGLTGGEIEVIGYRGMKEYELGFDGFRVPGDGLLGGEEGQGFRQLMATFESARIQTAARAIGVGQAALDVGLGYAIDRQQFGRAIIAFPRIANKLAVMAAELMGVRQLTYHAARRKDEGRRCDLEAGMAKLIAARIAWAAADNALQIHGGNGFAMEYPVSRLLADARILNIFEGAGEIQAQVIARRLLDGAN